MQENKLIKESTNFAISVITQCEKITKHYSIVNQLERAATSIGANVHEAQYAQSRADFISKLQIALKECYETEYWLTIVEKTNLLKQEEIKPLKNQCGTIRRVLISSINTTKNNTK